MTLRVVIMGVAGCGKSFDNGHMDDKPTAAIPVLSQLLQAEIAERDVRSIACHLNYSA